MLSNLRLDYTLADSSVTDLVTMAPGDYFDATYAIFAVPEGAVQALRCRFERSGNFDAAAIAGTGGVNLFPPPGGLLTVTFEFTSTEWVGNGAGSGPAIYLQYGNYYLVVSLCLFR